MVNIEEQDELDRVLASLPNREQKAFAQAVWEKARAYTALKYATALRELREQLTNNTEAAEAKAAIVKMLHDGREDRINGELRRAMELLSCFESFEVIPEEYRNTISDLLEEVQRPTYKAVDTFNADEISFMLATLEGVRDLALTAGITPHALFGRCIRKLSAATKIQLWH